MRTSVNTQTISFPLHLLCLKRLACVSSFFTFNQSCWKLPFYFFAIPLAFCFHGCEVTLIFSVFSLLLIYFGIVKDHSYVTHLNWPLYNFDTFIFSSLGFLVLLCPFKLWAHFMCSWELWLSSLKVRSTWV